MVRGSVKNHLLVKILSFAVIASLFFSPYARAQTLSLADAIWQALEHNQTILYNAEQQYQIALAQLEATEAGYRRTLNTNVAFTRTYSHSEPASLSAESYSVTTESQQVYPDLRLQQTFLTPFGSRLTASVGQITTMDVFGSPTFQTNTQVALSLQQPISGAGMASGHADIIQAKEGFKVAEMSYELQKEQLVLAVVQSYFQVWQAERSLEQSESDSASAHRLWELAKLKLKSGMIPESELLNLEVQYWLALDNLQLARNNLQTQFILFKRLLGDTTKTPIKLSSDIPEDSLAIDLDGAIDTALHNRIEIKQAEIALALTDLSIAQTASAFAPSLRFDLAYNFSSMQETSFFNAFAHVPNYGLNLRATLSFPILDGGRNAAQVEVARRNLDIQQKNLQLLKEEIAIDIENRHRTLQLNQRRLRSLALSLEVAAEALKIAELKFNAGQVSSTDIENVRNRYNAAQNALNSAKISFVVERAGLAQAMGELFDWVEQLRK